jgi:hypothetical protein
MDRGRVARSAVDRRRRGPKAPEHGLRPLRSTEARRRGHNRERGTRLGPHRGSGDGGEIAEERKLSNSDARASEEGENEMGEVR